MRNQYRETETHCYVVGYHPDYKAYLDQPHLHYKEPEKYWVGVGKKCEYGVEYDTLIKSNSRDIVEKCFQEETR